MFGHGFYYHGIIRKYVIMFGNMFNDLRLTRYNSSGVIEQIMEIPISYGPKERFLIRLREDPSLNKKVAVQLPRLSFELLSVSYDSTRTFNKSFRNSSIGTTNNELKTQFTAVPYNFEFALYGMFANNEDAVQVLEQILPFFRPEWTHSLKLIPEMGEYYDIPTVLTSVDMQDTYDSDFTSRRSIIYTWNFTVKGYLFGPISNRGIIKRTQIDFSTDTNVSTSPVESRLILTPGLLANGQPTTNSAASVAASLINANSNYGFAFDSNNFFNGSIT
jgi:hypothetical protein